MKNTPSIKNIIILITDLQKTTVSISSKKSHGEKMGSFLPEAELGSFWGLQRNQLIFLQGVLLCVGTSRSLPIICIGKLRILLSKIDHRTCTVMQQNTKEQNLSTLNNLCSVECFAHVSASVKKC